MVQDNLVQDLPTLPLEGDLADDEEVVNSSESCESGLEDEPVIVSPVKQSQSDDQINQEAASPVVQDNGPKKSYASIVS